MCRAGAPIDESPDAARAWARLVPGAAIILGVVLSVGCPTLDDETDASAGDAPRTDVSTADAPIPSPIDSGPFDGATDTGAGDAGVPACPSAT